MTARIRSLAVTPSGSSPSTVIAMVRNGASGRVWVASTCSTWLVPMPNASAPKAPWVEVWESPQTTVVPGWVRPSWGPTTCTTPCSTSPSEWIRTPNSAALRRRVSSCTRETGSAIGLSMSRVGVLWSSVAIVRSVRRTLRPASRSPSKACGLVTSWSRCRSMNRRSGSPSTRRTTWSSQTFSASVRPIGFPPAGRVAGLLVSSGSLRAPSVRSAFARPARRIAVHDADTLARSHPGCLPGCCIQSGAFPGRLNLRLAE